jgi:hypothetical protein
VFADQLEVYYYKDGVLAAVELDDKRPDGWGCVAGPSMFFAPGCVRSNDRLQCPALR